MLFPFFDFHKTIHRRILERYLERFALDIRGEILDVGSGSRRYDHLLRGHVTAVDNVPNPEKGIQRADANALPFPDNRFDAVLAIEVFEYLVTPERAAAEVYRVVKPGGVAIVSSPLMYRFHNDYLRYTEKYLKEVLFHRFSHVELYPIGNFYTIFLDMLLAKMWKVRQRPLRYLFYLASLPLFLLRPLAERFAHDPELVSGYMVKARK